MLAIVDAIEGRAAAFRCAEIRQRGPAALEGTVDRLTCPINATMLCAELAWRNSLDAPTGAALVATLMAALVAGRTEQADHRASEKTVAWFQERLRR